MRTVLFSIKPEHVVRIINGEKTRELRKRIPSINPGFIGLIYCSASGKYAACIDKDGVAVLLRKTSLPDAKTLGLAVLNGKVCVQFTCNGYTVISNGIVTPATQKVACEACVSNQFIQEYSNGKDVFALQLDNVYPFRPLPLSVYGLKRPPQSWQFIGDR